MSITSDHLSPEELVFELEQAAKLVDVGGYYLHYRDPVGRYKVLNLAIIEATQKPAVVYQKEFGSDALRSIVWIRPVNSWIEEVSFDGKTVPRFRKI